MNMIFLYLEFLSKLSWRIVSYSARSSFVSHRNRNIICLPSMLLAVPERKILYHINNMPFNLKSVEYIIDTFFCVALSPASLWHLVFCSILREQK